MIYNKKNNKNIFLILSILLVLLCSLNITAISYRSSEKEAKQKIGVKEAERKSEM